MIAFAAFMVNFSLPFPLYSTSLFPFHLISSLTPHSSSRSNRLAYLLHIPGSFKPIHVRLILELLDPRFC